MELGLPNRLKFKIYSMKKCIYIALLCLTSWTIFAQEPEQIDLGPYGGTIVIGNNKKQTEYFETQIKLWEKKVHQNKKDANAWLNYFAATKCAYQMETNRIIEAQEFRPRMYASKYKFDEIAKDANKHIPNTFEVFYMLHFQDNKEIKKNYSYLLKANELKPYDQRILFSLLRYYDLVNDPENVQLVAQEIAKTSFISTNAFNLAYNILTELEEKSLLITSLSNFYACIILQKTKGIKPNAIITTKNGIFPYNQYEQPYINKLYNRIGTNYSGLMIDSSGTENEKDNNFYRVKNSYFDTLLATSIPIYFSNLFLSDFKYFEDKIYLHGLTYRYSKLPANYIYKIKDNYEKNYSLDYIKHDFSPTPSDNYEQSLYFRYYYSALKLYQFYMEKGMYLQQQEMKKFIKQIAEKSGKKVENLIQTIDKPIDYPFIAEKIDFIKTEKSFVALDAVEHMGKFEVTNKEYRLFLNNLKKQKNYDLYVKCMVDTNKWNTVFPMAFHDPMANMYAWHPAYDNYPVVNISYEGAVAYCKWLTEQYNQQHPEGKYVSFRLPTEQEWRYAAGSKNAKALTPFQNGINLTSGTKSSLNYNPLIYSNNGSKIELKHTNKNFEATNYINNNESHIVVANSYFPNDLGLYNTFGNVAEMTNTKGVIKGGSWADVFEDCTFDKNVTYSAPDPRVGFRIMMEVVPEIKHNSVVKIEKNLYCRKYEDRIYDYERYLKNIIQLYGINSIEYKNAFPDSTLWKNENIQALNNVLNVPKLKDSLKIIRAFEKSFALLDTLTKTQLDNYLKYKSDEEFKAYLIENEYIKNLYMHNNPPIFTKEAYYTGKLDSICLKEKFMYYPVLRLPTEYEKQLANTYTTKQLQKSEYAPTNPNSIYSNFVNQKYFDLVKHKSKSFPNGYYTTYELKLGVKLSDIKPFDLWENYRFVMTWNPWNPNQTK